MKHEMLKKQVDAHADRSMEIGEDDILVTIQKGAMRDMKHLTRVLASETIPAVLASNGPGQG